MYYLHLHLDLYPRIFPWASDSYIYLTEGIPIITCPEVNFWPTPTQKNCSYPMFPIISTNYSLEETNTLINFEVHCLSSSNTSSDPVLTANPTLLPSSTASACISHQDTCGILVIGLCFHRMYSQQNIQSNLFHKWVIAYVTLLFKIL